MAKKVFIGLACCLIAVTIWIRYGETKDEAISSGNQVKKIASKIMYPGDASDWNLILVNEQNKIEKEPTNLKELPNGEKIEGRIYEDYNNLVKAAAKQGYQLIAISGYRSVQEQTNIVKRDIANYQSQGYSEEEAKKKAMEYLTEPGLSEHHTGLAIDVLEQEWYNKGNTLEGEFGDTPAGKWIEENACQYGFIVRYEIGKESITGINYEPWHIRYVGTANALYMKKHNLSLEEYVEKLKE